MHELDEKKLHERIARLGDNELVRTIFLFEHIEQIDVTMRDMMATVFPDQQLPEQGVDMMALLRGELRKRVLSKSRGTAP